MVVAVAVVGGKTDVIVSFLCRRRKEVGGNVFCNKSDPMPSKIQRMTFLGGVEVGHLKSEVSGSPLGLYSVSELNWIYLKCYVCSQAINRGT